MIKNPNKWSDEKCEISNFPLDMAIQNVDISFN